MRNDLIDLTKIDCDDFSLLCFLSLRDSYYVDLYYRDRYIVSMPKYVSPHELNELMKGNIINNDLGNVMILLLLSRNAVRKKFNQKTYNMLLRILSRRPLKMLNNIIVEYDMGIAITE